MTQQPNPPSQGSSPQGSAPQTSSSQTRRVLVVEDEKALALGIEDALGHAGFQASVVHDGQQAIDRIRQDPPDLIVLDLMLPSVKWHRHPAHGAPRGRAFTGVIPDRHGHRRGLDSGPGSRR